MQIKRCSNFFSCLEKYFKDCSVEIVFRCGVLTCGKSLADQVVLSLTMSKSQETSAVASDTDLQCNVEQIINLYVL